MADISDLTRKELARRAGVTACWATQRPATQPATGHLRRVDAVTRAERGQSEGDEGGR
jgi:hypothetical protein